MSLGQRAEDRPIKAVLFGLGRAGMSHLKALAYQERKGRFELVAVVDREPDSARAKLAKFAYNIPVFTSASDLLDQCGDRLFAKKTDRDRASRVFTRDFASLLVELKTELEDQAGPGLLEGEDGPATSATAAKSAPLFIFATPSGLHFEQAVRSLLGGAHLLLEKPVAMTGGQADLLQDLDRLSARRGLVTAVGHKYRYIPPFQDLAADLLTGTYGRPLYAQVSVRWGHDQAYYRPEWRGSLDQDGGALLNQSIHGVDLGAWLLGGQVIEEAVGLKAKLVHEIEAEDYGAGVLRFDNGSYLSLDGSTASDPDCHEARLYVRYAEAELRASILAGKPRLSIRDSRGRERRWDYLRRALANLIKQEGLRGIGLVKNPHTLIYSDLGRAIKSGEKSLAPLEAGALAVKLTAGLLEADKS